MKWDLGRLAGPRQWLGTGRLPVLLPAPPSCRLSMRENSFLCCSGERTALAARIASTWCFIISPAKVRDFLHLFQNFIAVGFVGAQGFPEFDAAHFYLGPGFHISLLCLNDDLAQALDLRARQAQVNPDRSLSSRANSLSRRRRSRAPRKLFPDIPWLTPQPIFPKLRSERGIMLEVMMLFLLPISPPCLYLIRPTAYQPMLFGLFQGCINCLVIGLSRRVSHQHPPIDEAGRSTLNLQLLSFANPRIDARE